MFDIRDNLKLFIDERCYNQSSIAKKAKLTPAQFSSVLNKSRKLEANELFDICEALGITPNELKAYISDKKQGA